MAGKKSAAQVARIIQAAIGEFARDGLAGARVDAIAAQAGVNKRMLYHHVGDKQALFDAAVADCSAHLLAWLAAPGAATAVARTPASATPDPDHWRVLCAALAAGQSPMVEARSRRSGQLDPSSSASTYQGLNEEELELIVIALEMLAALWPALVETRLSGHGATRGIRELLQKLARPSPDHKPRVKLKPELRATDPA